MGDSLGARLKRARLQIKMTQGDVCQILGISIGTLSGYERDYRKPDPTMLLKLSELYSVTTDFLVGKSFSGQKSESKRDESHTELSDNSDTLEFHPGAGFNSQHSQNVIDFALQQMHKEDAFKIDTDITMIPVLGTIKAGYDLYAEQQVIGMEPVAKQSVSDGAEYFFLVVKGDSMSGDNIREGMRVLVRRQDWVEKDKIAVVLVNGDEATLKRVYVHDNGMVSLVASNTDYPPRLVPAEDAKIQGQVKQVVWDV